MKNILSALVLISVAALCSAQKSVKIDTQSIEIDTNIWQAMTNEEEYAENFQENQCDSTIFKHCRVVTIFKIPMSEDRKTGIKLSQNEYVDVFVVHPGFVTVQVRIDKNNYWVMSRETYQNPDSLKSLSMYDAFPNQKKQKELLAVFQNNVDKTRYLLRSTF